MRKYKIQGYFDKNDDKYLYWSNEDGWVDFESATIFGESFSALPLEATGIVILNDKGKICGFQPTMYDVFAR